MAQQHKMYQRYLLQYDSWFFFFLWFINSIDFGRIFFFLLNYWIFIQFVTRFTMTLHFIHGLQKLMTLLSLFQTWWQWVVTWMESTMRMGNLSSPAPSISASVLLEQLAAHQHFSRNLQHSWALHHWLATYQQAFAATSPQGSISRTRPTCQVCVYEVNHGQTANILRLMYQTQWCKSVSL